MPFSKRQLILVFSLGTIIANFDFANINNLGNNKFVSTASATVKVTAKNKRGPTSKENRSKDTKVSVDNRALELGQVKSLPGAPTSETSVILNDPAIAQKWDIQKTDAQRGWAISQGSRNVVVAVIDTGCDVRHEDLEANMWKNPGETGVDANGKSKETNGIDDDNNGFVDDVYGWNFVSNNNDVTDNHGHGTHIAGIIGAVGGNGKGISGISPKVSMMTLKYFDPKVPGTDNLKNTVRSIKYAIKMKANIINYSGGGADFSKEERDAVDEARNNGILFVAAAGNEWSNSDTKKYYPADYGLVNIISVTAIDPKTEVLSSSNYGVLTVDIAAPGQNILSTLPKNTYGYLTGTSQATAFVTGAAAVVTAHKNFPGFAEVKKFILATGDSFTSLLEKTATTRRLNLFKSLVIRDSGETATGVKAVNDSQIKAVINEKGSANLSTDPNSVFDSARDATNLGQTVLDAIEQTDKTEKTDRPDRTDKEEKKKRK